MRSAIAGDSNGVYYIWGDILDWVCYYRDTIYYDTNSGVECYDYINYGIDDED